MKLRKVKYLKKRITNLESEIENYRNDSDINKESIIRSAIYRKEQEIVKLENEITEYIERIDNFSVSEIVEKIKEYFDCLSDPEKQSDSMYGKWAKSTIHSNLKYWKEILKYKKDQIIEEILREEKI